MDSIEASERRGRRLVLAAAGSIAMSAGSLAAGPPIPGSIIVLDDAVQLPIPGVIDGPQADGGPCDLSKDQHTTITCWNCLMQLLQQCDEWEDDDLKQGCIAGANKFFEVCLGWVGEAAIMVPSPAGLELLDVRAPFITFFTPTPTLVEDIRVWRLVDGELLRVGTSIEPFDVDSIEIAVDELPLGWHTLAITVGEIPGPTWAHFAHVPVTDSYDLTGDGAFDILDTLEARDLFIQQQISFHTLVAMVDALD